MLSLSAFADVLNISTPRTTLLLQADKSDELKVIYYGTKLSDADAKTVEQTAKDKFAAYPVYGMNGADEAALSVLHADGNMSLQMVVQGTETKKDGDARITVVKMKDRVYPFFVNVFYKAYDNVDMIETWTEISHQEKKNVDLQKFLSGSLPIRRGDVWISSLYGSWANEARLCQEPLTPGVKMIKNKDAVNPRKGYRRGSVLSRRIQTVCRYRRRRISPLLCRNKRGKFDLPSEEGRGIHNSSLGPYLF